jgi:hypothetical protein
MNRRASRRLIGANRRQLCDDRVAWPETAIGTPFRLQVIGPRNKDSFTGVPITAGFIQHACAIDSPVSLSGIGAAYRSITARNLSQQQRNYRSNFNFGARTRTLLPHQCHTNHLACLAVSD